MVECIQQRVSSCFDVARRASDLELMKNSAGRSGSKILVVRNDGPRNVILSSKDSRRYRN